MRQTLQSLAFCFGINRIFPVMDSSARIQSILNAAILSEAITGFPVFQLSELRDVDVTTIELPTNVRLGQLIEKVVSNIIQSSSNYAVLHESVQIIEEKQTIGELDFLLQEKITKEIMHVELAYKFYLLDLANFTWIGPNRKDALQEKLEKLRSRQFPLLYHVKTAEILSTMTINTIAQKLCLIASLFVPYEYKGKIDPLYEQAIVGYYLNFETFRNLHTEEKRYCFPSKKHWGIAPSENNSWATLATIEATVQTSLNEKRSVLCWENEDDQYKTYFIVWW